MGSHPDADVSTPSYYSNDGGVTWLTPNDGPVTIKLIGLTNEQVGCVVSGTSVADATGTYKFVNKSQSDVHSTYDVTYGVWTNGKYNILYCTDYWQGWTLIDDLTIDPASASTRVDIAMAAGLVQGNPPWNSYWQSITIVPTTEIN